MPKFQKNIGSENEPKISNPQTWCLRLLPNKLDLLSDYYICIILQIMSLYILIRKINHSYFQQTTPFYVCLKFFFFNYQMSLIILLTHHSMSSRADI